MKDGTPTRPRFHTGEFAGWPNCVFIQHGETELVATTDVGPRILRCGLLQNAPNIFKTFDDDLGVTSGEEYRLFGGHRLWHSPEAWPRSYSPDFAPVEYHWDEQELHLEQRVEPDTGIRKSITIDCMADGSFRVRHRLRNEGLWPVRLAAWSMTLMAGGCRAIVPQEEFRPHPEHLDPARTMTLWHYTRMDDPRVNWGAQFIQVTENPGVNRKFKVGLGNRQRWAACWSNGCLFIKTFAFEPGAEYPDGGCNLELFTMPGFLELESLGPLTTVAPQDTVVHDEIWHLWPLAELPHDEDALADALAPYLSRLQFPDGRGQ